MTRTNDTGLAAIARSTRKAPSSGQQPTQESASASAEGKPVLELAGRLKRTSIAFDAGLWKCVDDTADVLTKRLRARGNYERVAFVKVLRTAFIAFHELPLEQQLELIRRHD